MTELEKEDVAYYCSSLVSIFVKQIPAYYLIYGARRF